MNRLPPEITSLIIKNVELSDLCNCALINKRFYIEASHLLWQVPNVRSMATCRKVIKGLVGAQHQLGHHVRTLEFCQPLDNATLLLIIKHTTHLEELQILNGHRLTDEGFQHLPRYCPNLKTLCLGYTSLTHSFQAVGQHCRQLRKLVLKECDLLPNVFATLDHLEEVTLGSADIERWMTIETFLDMTRLDLTHLSVHGFPTFANHLLTGSWPLLTDFALAGDCELDTLVAFITSHPRLTSVDLPEHGISDLLLALLPSVLPNLRKLHLDYNGPFNSLSIRRLIWDCPWLTFLSLSGCDVLVDDFPEADQDPWVSEFVDFLNETAIEKIRHGTDQDLIGN